MAPAARAATTWRRNLNGPSAAPLPNRNGVGPGCVVLPTGPWQRIIDFLVERFRTLSRDEIEARMQRGEIVDDSGNPVLPSRAYAPHLKLHYYRTVDVEPRIPFEEVVLFQDDHLVVVDKPHFLPVTPSGSYVQETLLVRLINKLGIKTLAPMHRLDRETAGVMIFTVQPDLRGCYQELFAHHKVTKQYEAIAPFRPELNFPITRHSRLVNGEPFMRMREALGNELGPPNAYTKIELLEVLQCNTLARYRLNPTSGKKHQLRVHMAALGIPIVNDMLYPSHKNAVRSEVPVYNNPLQLLAHTIAFLDPVTGTQRQFTTGFALNIPSRVNVTTE